MTRRTLPSLAAAALALPVLAGAPRAQASVGDLDPTFDGDGRVVFRHVNPIDGAYAVVVQPDGKLLALGTARDGDERRFVVAHRLASGGPDPSFGSAGATIVEIGGTFGAAASDLALALDGNVYAAGSVLGVPAGGQQAVVRLTGDSPVCPSPPDPEDDADGDGVHDLCDVCPAVADPGQEDADGDGAGDACDVCPDDPTDSCLEPSCAVATKARLVLGKLHTPAGDDTLVLSGEATLPHPFEPPLDPVASAVELRVTGASDATVLDVAIPGGAYDKVSKEGWRTNVKKTVWTYRSRAGVQGVTLVTLRLVPKTPGKVTFRVKGQNGSYPVALDALPLAARLVFDPATAGTSGQCADALFPGPARPAPTCTTNPKGSTVTCR